ncbi:MAG: 5-formyltetrahydrofolate cyclo-ligase [Rhodospirillales bacterium]|nr:5-formyltetrahydrofolate cyclo-ligase [Rhodospirillales bacterium]
MEAFLPIASLPMDQQPTPIDEQKRRLRKRMRALRLVADQKEGPNAARQVTGHVLGHLAELGIRPGAVVAGYWPIITELDVRPLMARLDAAGIVCALPAIVGECDVLRFRRWRPTDDVEIASLDTRQPPASAPEVIPDVLLVPLLAVDRSGNRLGQGKGWYDRTLAALRRQGRPVAVGIGFDVQVIAHVPHGPGDETMDWVASEQAIEASAVKAAAPSIGQGQL